MKIIHTSDWHLGISLHNASLIEEQKNFIEFLIEAVKKNGIDAVMIAGDIFDHSVSSAEAISLYNYAVTELCNEIGIPVIISAGNHDGAVRLASCSELLKKTGLYVFGKLTNEVAVVELKNADVYVLPYFNIDETRAIFPNEKINSYLDAMKCVLDNMNLKFRSGRKNILMSHCFVSGSVLSESDRSAMVGGASVVPSEIFEGFDYVALGHLHKPQNRGFNARYSGSPLKYSFSEADHQKSVTILNIEDEITIQELEVVPSRDIRVIRGTYEEILKIAENDLKKDDYIKIEMTDKYAGMEAVEVFRSYYENLLNITGKVNEAEENELTVNELYTLSPNDILEKFYKEATGNDLTDEQNDLFNQALFSVEGKEDAAQ
ncbi:MULTISPECIES: exonuclease SbcCD subunit D [unclassified Sedimentibacter]|uniref:exonuclease SbcCD subunit D n=1 Tax=unclassified Sedimentibacter TaxID=2649220 RepID=UPI0027E18D00|nr:exonuclease SbcCD subunit D [Sedimentibacter sp. MB35-C1]WMJ76802.1 exonuclease SbcCD subunit D [Sedimentibacter sp. MB35-C1]